MTVQNKSRMQLAIALISYLIGNLTSSIFSFVLSMYVLKLTGSSFTFSVILLINPLITALLSPAVGYFVDTFNHKKVSLLSQAASVAMMVIFLIAHDRFTTPGEIILIGITVVVLSLCDSFQSTSYKASTIHMVVENHQQTLIAWEQLMSTIVILLYPTLGGVFYGFLSVEIIAVIELCGELVVLIAIACLNFYLVAGTKKNETDTDSSHKESLRESFKTGLSYMASDSALINLLIFAIIANFALAAINVGLPVVFLNQLKINTSLYGIVQSCLALGMIVSSLLLGIIKLKGNNLRLTSYAGFALTIGLVIMAADLMLSPPQTVLVIIFAASIALIGMAITATNLPFGIYIRTQIDEDKQGRVSAMSNAVVSFLSPVGMALYGFLFDHVAAGYLFLVSGFILLADTIVLFVRGGKAPRLTAKN